VISKDDYALPYGATLEVSVDALNMIALEHAVKVLASTLSVRGV